MVPFFNFIIASKVFATDILPNMEDMRYFKVFIPSLELFKAELRVVLYPGASDKHRMHMENRVTY